jgi:hypothetical protein
VALLKPKRLHLKSKINIQHFIDIYLFMSSYWSIYGTRWISFHGDNQWTKLNFISNMQKRSKLEYASVAWNNLTLTNSNRIENIQRKFYNLWWWFFFKSDTSSTYDLILSHLNFRPLYSRWWHLDALFLINVFKGKINCNFIMDTVGIVSLQGK